VAIGSAPEIGVSFTTIGEMTEEQKEEFFKSRPFGPDGLEGYATLAYPPGRKPS
jgi:hypothetical protein